MTSKLDAVRDMPGEGKLFRIRVVDDDYQDEIHWILDETYFVAVMSSFKNQVTKAEAILADFVRNVKYSKDAGTDYFCLGNIAVTGRYRSESASFNFDSVSTPDISFSIDIDTYGKDDVESLRQRLSDPNSLLKKFNIHESVLRKGETHVAGMRAQEWASAIRPGEKGNEQDLSFLIETMRPTPSAAAPKIHLEMEVKGQSAHDESGAEALWDRVTKTIRAR